MDGEVAVEIKNVSKAFNDRKILQHLDLKLIKGENLVVLGKSGVGKSVLIKCIVRLVDADEGTVTVLGSDVSTLNSDALDDLRRKVGFLFQSAALYDSLSVRENLEFPLRHVKKAVKEDINQLVKEALDNVGLGDAVDKMPAELSGGMRKRIGLARTLILKPEIMLYDEPTTGLDPITSREISQLILDMQKKYKTSSIIITHDIECARLTANRVMVIKEGKAVAEGTFEELEKSTDPFIHSFFE